MFAIDWFLYHTVRLWRAFGSFQYSIGTYTVEIMSLILSYTNCCCNPVIYAFVSRSFRQDFKRAMLCRYLVHARECVNNKFVAMSFRRTCKDEARCLHIAEERTNYTTPDKSSPFVPKKPTKFFVLNK